MSLPGQLYKLQQVDLELQRMQQELNEIEDQLNNNEVLATAESKLTAQNEQLAEMKKEQKSSEWELEDLRERVHKLSDKLYGGSTKNPKELLNLEDEVKSFKSRIIKKEDELLELMSQVEEMEAKLNSTTEEFKQVKQEWQQNEGNLKQRKTKIETELAEFSEARHRLVQQIDPAALRLYEKVRVTKEPAVAKVERGRCQGCYITLPISQWRKAKAGDLVQCSSCNRILYLE